MRGEPENEVTVFSTSFSEELATTCTCIIYMYIYRSIYMEIHVLSTLAYGNKKGNSPNHDPDKQTYIAGCPALRTGVVG